MCGILGYFNLNKTSDFNPEFGNSLEKLTHRGPDQFGIVQFKSKNIIGEFGHTRLSIIDETINEVENIPIFNSYSCKKLLNNYYKYPESVNSRLVWRIINYTKWYSINFKN